MFKVGRTLILAVGFTAFVFILAAMMSVPSALAQTMGEYGATVGSSASSAGTLGSSVGSGTSSVGSNVSGGSMNMGVGGGDLQPGVVTGQGAPRTIIIGGGDNSHYAHSPSRADDEDDATGDAWTEVK